MANIAHFSGDIRPEGIDTDRRRAAMTALPAGGLEIRARCFNDSRENSSALENLLTRDQQQRLQRDATLLTYRRGNMIFAQGEDAHFAYFVRDGMIRIAQNGENERRQILNFSVPGDVFGIPDGGRYANSAEDPQLQVHLLSKFASDLRHAQARIVTLGVHSTLQRLASFLLEFASLPSCFDAAHQHLKVPLNRLDLADYLGSAPESTARALTMLENKRLIRRVNSRTFEILDIQGLEEVRRGHRKRRRFGNNLGGSALLS
jgi:CRP-like cAMP-binding protein